MTRLASAGVQGALAKRLYYILGRRAGGRASERAGGLRQGEARQGEARRYLVWCWWIQSDCF